MQGRTLFSSLLTFLHLYRYWNEVCERMRKEADRITWQRRDRGTKFGRLKRVKHRNKISAYGRVFSWHTWDTVQVPYAVDAAATVVAVVVEVVEVVVVKGGGGTAAAVAVVVIVVVAV